MRLSDFDYTLPPEQIAQTAIEPRDSSRLLVIHRTTGQLEHHIFRDLPDYLRSGDVLVLNQTRVIPARLHAIKIPGGGAAELLLIERIDDRRWLAMVGGKRIIAGTQLALQADGVPDILATVVEVREESQRVVEFSQPIEPYLDQLGERPRPPYIHQPLEDAERYQTVYGHTPGSVAAPTAGLHFTPELLLAIKALGVEIVYCTLHVGPGTFQPVKTEDVSKHHMHEEYAELLPEDARRLNEAKLRGGRVFAVGSTSMRTLETAAIKSAGEAGGGGFPRGPPVTVRGANHVFLTPRFPILLGGGLRTKFFFPHTPLRNTVNSFFSP